MSTPLAIVGRGNMGKLVERLAPEYGFDVVAYFAKANIATLSHAALNGATVAVEFTTPTAAPHNVRLLAALGVNTVCGTTGWYEDLAEIRRTIAEAKTALVYGPNFSIGMNLFSEMIVHAARIFADHPEYEAWGWEIHHSAKKDAPSGTLKNLAGQMRSAGFTGSLTLSSNRAGAHVGTHEIGFDSPADTITLRHTSRNREGYARGALQAARWIAGKQGVFEFYKIVSELHRVAVNGLAL